MTSSTPAARTPAASAPTYPAHTQWPAGFHRNPLKFARGKQAWKAMGWSFTLALTGLPLLFCAVSLFPWIPLIARVAEQISRAGAQWMGIYIAPRKPATWFDVRQVALLFAIVALSLACVFVFTLPFGNYGYPRIITFSNDGAETSGIRFLAHILFVILFWILILVYASWGLTLLSISACRWANNASEKEVQRSREILIDAFTGERRRIERELHDGVQQYLTALQLNIATLELVQPNPSAPARRAMDQAQQNAQRALEALRATIRGIYPQVLQDKGLVEALRELVAHSGIDGTVQCHAPAPPLGDTAALLLYHAAAEGITNATRHGQATKVQVTLLFDATHATLHVDDNGAGVGIVKQGTGIAGVQERAAALGGAVSLGDSELLGGACLSVRVPVAKGR